MFPFAHTRAGLLPLVVFSVVDSVNVLLTAWSLHGVSLQFPMVQTLDSSYG